jgi:cell division septation protein DedD
LHRIRVGSFTDRAAAEAALKDLKARGYRPVLTRGNE